MLLPVMALCMSELTRETPWQQVGGTYQVSLSGSQKTINLLGECCCRVYEFASNSRTATMKAASFPPVLTVDIAARHSCPRVNACGSSGIVIV